MNSRILTEEYKVTSYLVNLRGEAGLHSVLSFVQDVGWLHALKLNVKLPEGLGWVFTRQKLKMIRWPKWNDTVTLKTWLRPPDSNKFLIRDYELSVNGFIIGRAASTFSAFDLLTRKISLLDWNSNKEIFQPDGHHDFVPEKILVSGEVEELAQFKVRNSDLDLNNHVNNTKYAHWILDSIPLEIITSQTQLVGYEINYLSEAKPGDFVIIKKSKTERFKDGFYSFQFQGFHETKGNLIFSAELTTTERTQ